MKEAMLVGLVEMLEVLESHVPIVMAILVPCPARRKLARTRAPTSIPSWSMKLMIVFRCIRGVGRFFQGKGKNCKLVSRRNHYHQCRVSMLDRDCGALIAGYALRQSNMTASPLPLTGDQKGETGTGAPSPRWPPLAQLGARRRQASAVEIPGHAIHCPPCTTADRFPSGESICDWRNPITGSAEFHMLLDVDEFLCDARRHSAAHAFRSDAIEQPSLHIFSGVESTCT